jgi:hypothetical protein
MSASVDADSLALLSCLSLSASFRLRRRFQFKGRSKSQSFYPGKGMRDREAFDQLVAASNPALQTVSAGGSLLHFFGCQRDVCYSVRITAESCGKTTGSTQTL